jgi:hypothetical protein
VLSILWFKLNYHASGMFTTSDGADFDSRKHDDVQAIMPFVQAMARK